MLKKIFSPPEGLTSKDIPLPGVFGTSFDYEEKRIHVNSPPKLCVYNNESSYITYLFLGYIEEVIFKHKAAITINFENLTELTAAASLLIFAKITKCQICTKEPTGVAITLPIDKKLRQLFVDTGLWNGIKPGGIGKVRKLINQNNQYLSGSSAPIDDFSKVIAATMISLVEKQSIIDFDRAAISLFTRGVQEAVLNVKYHAYQNKPIASNYEEVFKGRWWQCCWLDHAKQQIVFIIYDDGVGIINALEEQCEKDTPSHEVIKHAMTLGVTSSPLASRGEGSRNIIEASCTIPHSNVVIMSGDGYYCHDESGVTSKELPFKLKGTLVQWVLNCTKES
jgi:hypothetical protein